MIKTSMVSLDDGLVKKVLEFAKEGVTKKDMMDRFSLSRPRVRRLTAELVSKDLLKQHVNQNFLITTARGNKYISQKKNARQKIDLDM